MPWTTPTLGDVRKMTRDYVTTQLRTAALVPNSVLRVIADATSGLAHLVLQYIDWLARQFLPDTAEREWLDRHAQIWLVNADGSKGRRAAAAASGVIAMTGVDGVTVPASSVLRGTNAVEYETTRGVVLGVGPTDVHVRALTPGAISNGAPGDKLYLNSALASVDSEASVVILQGGADAETDDELRVRVLERIQKPPMGGSADDYVAWAKMIPAVTRAWAYPNEMGVGTVTVRFMMDDLRATSGGIPNADDLAALRAHMDLKRPVAVKDFFVVAPIPQPVNFVIRNLVDDKPSTRAAIKAALKRVFALYAQPGAPIYYSVAVEAIASASGERHHELILQNEVPATNGHIPVLGSIIVDDAVVFEGPVFKKRTIYYDPGIK